MKKISKNWRMTEFVKVKILIVSYVDDNFGDNLIRICFEHLLNVVFKNLQLKSDDFEINRMPLKQIDESMLVESDIIAFAGGGLFGLSYLGFFDWLNRITELAEENDIPVFFSSMGLNNMGVSPENEHLIRDLFKRKCIKALSVRENLRTFQEYAGDCDFKICKVCDPAVWARYVYNSHLSGVPKNGGTVGINVVRGGLFADNGKPWKLGDEINYINELRQQLESQGVDYVFYTNGSFLDDNTLHYYADKFDIPAHKLVFPNTTREWVLTVAQFDCVASIRMHSSILSYALGIPSVNLVWNDKIRFFYDDIGHADRAIELDQWNAVCVSERLREIKDRPCMLDEEYLMSLYKYLYGVMNNLLCIGADEGNMFDFDTVTRELSEMSVPMSEDSTDLVLKLSKSEKHYLARFKELRAMDEELRQQNRDLIKKKEELDRKNIQIKKLQARIDKFGMLPSVIVIRAIKRLVKKLRKVLVR